MPASPPRMPIPGSPAYAGIDPGKKIPIAHARRFPRIRGDRPLSAADMLTPDVVPPHTRG